MFGPRWMRGLKGKRSHQGQGRNPYVVFQRSRCWFFCYARTCLCRLPDGEAWAHGSFPFRGIRFDGLFQFRVRPGAEVEIAGVRVGRVKSIRLDDKQPRAIVELQLGDNVHLTDDVIASVKTSGLIGDKYISLEPGGSGEPLKSGDEITDTESAVDIESLISKYVFGKV